MTKKGKKKLFIIGGAAIVIAALVIVNLTRSSGKTTKVTTAKVKQGKLVSLVTASGKVKPKTEVKISANVSGEIVGLPVVEVHLSNIYSREDWRRHSVISSVTIGQVTGFKAESYALGLTALTDYIRSQGK